MTLAFNSLSWYRNSMKIRYIAALLLTATLMFSCATNPAAIPEDMTPEELIQRGQEASDKNRYKVSLQYYAAIIERFPFDVDSILAAEYETAFIHYKQKKYDVAKVEFNQIIERYNTPDEALLPPSFKILSGKILGKINEIENRRKKKEPETAE